MTKKKSSLAPQVQTAAGTVSKQSQTRGLIPFVKGDKRINRHGRPKSFDALRKLAQEIVNDDLAETGMTRLQAMLTRMTTSANPADRRLLLEYSFGKVKDELEVIGAMTDDQLRAAIAARVGITVPADAGSAAPPPADPAGA